ncbi:MAG: hypothetical protein KME45_21870 [Stenomitos rutilans HA7619-LM2]|jgi:hypothetical protein|nr:hypothetical protein [Stenomitos rutilans HA7619-LM2]
MSALTLPHTNGAKAASVIEPWQRESVKTFFTGINWEDHAPAIQEIKQSLAEGGNAPLSLKTSVCQFFAAVNWEGTAIAAPIPIQTAPTSTTNNLTLDDFSGLF